MKPAGSRPTVRSEALREIWKRHIEQVFGELDLDIEAYGDLIESVACYCASHRPEGIRTHELKLLIARSCCAVGERAAARRILESEKPYARHGAKWLELLEEPGSFSELLPYFSAEVLRPADWAGAQKDRMWVIDFSRLSFSPSEEHEILIYRSVYLLVGRVAPCWDGTSGDGVLALKGTELLGFCENELALYIGQLLAKLQADRGWDNKPSVLLSY